MKKSKSKLVIASLFCGILVFTIVDYIEANSNISKEWHTKIKNLQEISKNIETLSLETKKIILSSFDKEVKLLRDHGYPVRSLPESFYETGYMEYFNELCFIISQIQELDEDTIKTFLVFSDYYMPFKQVLHKKEKFWKLLKIWVKESDGALRKKVIWIFRLISVPPFDSDLNPEIFHKFNISLNKKEKEELKNIFLDALEDSYMDIRIIAIAGLKPYIKDPEVIAKLRKITTEDLEKMVREKAQEILNLTK